MISLIKRNLLIFFRDRAAVFFSLLSVFIIIGLYALFLGDIMVDSLEDIPKPKFLIDSWIVSGLLAVTSITATMGAFGIMIEDRTRKIHKDFFSSPVSKGKIAVSYILSSYVAGVIMTIVTLILGELYIVARGGNFLPITVLIKVFCLILLTTLASSSMVFFIVSLFKSQNAFASASAVTGAVIGFIMGIYIPIGNLHSGMQHVIRFFPLSHSGLLFRQTLMEIPLSESFVGSALEEHRIAFEEIFGVIYKVGDYQLNELHSIVFLLISTVLFSILAILNMSRKMK